MRIRLTFLALSLAAIGSAHADNLDDVIHAEMKRRNIPGLSIAIIEGGKIVRATAYGVIEKGGAIAVTPATLFQAGSISKPVAALGALYLVEQGKLALDENVNQKLVSWKVPDNDFTAEKKVTLRGLLSHSAGLTVHGFPGYATDAPAPTVLQVLGGEKPANTQPIRVDIAPGSKMRYSGGGYTVMQQLVVDVSGKPFPEFMDGAVLKPLGMQSSSFLQPPRPETARANATGHYGDRTVVPGRWHIYPEMAAAGLWTNPSDLARFAIGIQQSLAGSANPAISAALTRQMLTEQQKGVGLGLFLKGSGKEQQFSHGGRDEGFDASLTAYSETGQGAVVMINANDNSKMMQRIVAAIASQYRWPGAAESAVARAAEIAIDPNLLDSYAGRYEIANNVMVAFMPQQGRLVTISDGLPDEEFLATGPRQFVSQSGKTLLSFVDGEQGVVTAVVATTDGRERTGPRIGPLMNTLKPLADPQPARTAKVKSVLDAAALGTLTDAMPMTTGSKSNFGARKAEPLAGISSMVFLREDDVSGRSFERHGGKVERVLSYQVAIGGKTKYMLIFLTGDGRFTDYDFVTL